MESPSPSLAELLEGHTVLDVECFDRIYCNVYQPKLQTPGGTVYFLHDHRTNPIPSPALFRPMGDAYRKAVAAYAEDNGIEMITFKAGQRKIDVATPYLQKMKEPGVALIGKAITRIPEFMMPRQGVHPRGGGTRWREDRPYHVALEDRYIREHWDEIDALCRLNSLPLNATGETSSS